jgi:hypothetical protein
MCAERSLEEKAPSDPYTQTLPVRVKFSLAPSGHQRPRREQELLGHNEPEPPWFSDSLFQIINCHRFCLVHGEQDGRSQTSDFPTDRSPLLYFLPGTCRVLTISTTPFCNPIPHFFPP